MPLIRIVESTELSATSLLARDYIERRHMDIRTSRLEEGSSLDSGFVRDLVHEVEADSTPEVCLHQVWESLDRRHRRQVRVVGVTETHAEVENVETKHRTRISLAAFNGRGSKGYRLIGS